MCKGGYKVWKKILAGLFIGVSLFAISSTGYATGLTNINTNKTEPKVEQKVEQKVQQKAEQKVDITKYHLTEPTNEAYTIYDKITFINGKAPAGTSIIIEVYGTTDLTRKSFDLSKLPTDEDYIEVYKETIKAGNIGTFEKQLDLVTGINKIIIRFEVEGVDPIVLIVLVKNPETLNNIKESKITDLLPVLK